MTSAKKSLSVLPASSVAHAGDRGVTLLRLDNLTVRRRDRIVLDGGRDAEVLVFDLAP